MNHLFTILLKWNVWTMGSVKVYVDGWTVIQCMG
jgi:hypothetical protein